MPLYTIRKTPDPTKLFSDKIVFCYIFPTFFSPGNQRVLKTFADFLKQVFFFGIIKHLRFGAPYIIDLILYEIFPHNLFLSGTSKFLTISEPRNQEIGEFYVVLATDFEAPKW